MNPATISGSSFELRGPGGQLVTATVTYDGASRTAVLDPSASLAFGTTYQARVRGGGTGVVDLFGNPLAADSTWSFTTGAAPACPCSLWPSGTTPGVIDSEDGGAYELGVRFRADVDGLVTGLRFYKSSANVGTHVGHLWSSSGALLASATFTNESASGWQELAFSTPVAVTAGTVYTASYWVPNGHYSLSSGDFANAHTSGPLQALANGEAGNGVFRAGSSGFPDQSWNASNYWVDIVFVVPGADFTPPTVTSTTPAAAASGVGLDANVSVAFSEAMASGSIGATTFELRTSGGQVVSATVGYDPATRTATLNPTAALEANGTYTATVRGGTGGVADLAGNTLLADQTWSFTTGGGLGCPCSIWDPATTPAIVDSGDGYNYELGVKIQTQVNGYITRVRFYKSAANVGTHTGSLWTSTGALLATGTFTNETASGWQELIFSTPVPVTAGVTYVASYYAPNGRYSVDPGYFHAGDAGTGPVRAIGNATSSNGVFNAGGPGFPTGSYNAGNYWIDVVFVEY
jgi:hypothetical protein